VVVNDVGGTAGIPQGSLGLGIERVTAAEANEPLMDEYVYLAGRPPLRDYHHFMTEWARHSKTDLRRLTAEWRAAAARVEGLETQEAGIADDPVIAPLADHLEPLRAEVLNDPLFQQAFGTVPADIAVVELDRLVVYQKHVNVSYAPQVEGRLGSAPTEEDIFRVCLPFDHPQPVVRWMRSHHNTYVFFSPSNDLRFLDSAVLDFTQIFGYTPPGAVSAVVALMVGFGSNFLNAIHVENRLILNNGSHRAFGLRRMGLTHAPCIVQHVPSREELKAIASSALQRNLDLCLRHARPPMLKDYLDPELRTLVQVPRRLRQVRVKFELDEADVPAV